MSSCTCMSLLASFAYEAWIFDVKTSLSSVYIKSMRPTGKEKLGCGLNILIIVYLRKKEGLENVLNKLTNFMWNYSLSLSSSLLQLLIHLKDWLKFRCLWLLLYPCSFAIEISHQFLWPVPLWDEVQTGIFCTHYIFISITTMGYVKGLKLVRWTRIVS